MTRLVFLAYLGGLVLLTSKDLQLSELMTNIFKYQKVHPAEFCAPQ